MKRTPCRYIVSFAMSGELFNAGSKAPGDVIHFLVQDGWKQKIFPYMDSDKRTRLFKLPFYFFSLLLSPPRDSELLFIFPYHVFHPTVIKLIKWVSPWWKRREITTIGYVVDINSVRFADDDPALEMEMLKMFDKIIVHSPEMERFVRVHGYVGEVAILGLLDYAVEGSNRMDRKLSYDICFAGNLSKSVFLHTVDWDKFVNVRFFFYGLGFTEDMNQHNIVYRGTFSPENLSDVEGSWGLVWDGDSGNALDGFLGRYMKMNSPHKASMYICAGLPLIAPKGSFTADVVRERGVGLVIGSLDEIEAAIKAVTEDEYETMLRNINAFAERLMQGRQLKDAM